MPLDTDQLAFLRQLVSEPDESGGWTDARIAALEPGATSADGTLDLYLYASLIWDAKAADNSDMVNVSEAGSSRSLAQAFDHAVEMAKRFRASAGAGVMDPTSRPRSTRIVRPTRG